MNFQSYPPQPALARYVRFYWSLEDSASFSEPLPERIFPDGCTELIFHYGDLFQKSQAEKKLIQPRSFVHGQLKGYMDILPTGRTGMLSIRFHPQGLAAFLPCPVNLLNSENISVEELWSSAGKHLEEEVMNAPDNYARVLIIEEFLLARLKVSKQKNCDLYDQVGYIINQRGNTDIPQLAFQSNLSIRQLERNFISVLGLSPKLFARIIRFQAALKKMEGAGHNSLSSLAYDSEYYDQSHFIRDFRQFTGITPKAYLSNRSEMAHLIIE